MDKEYAVIREDEIFHFQDLGLGRGVDATNPSPWKNKKSFQVRQVRFEDIMGTEEGGSIQSYKSDVSSSTELQAVLKASVAVPHTPVTLGLEGEMSRSSSTSRKVVGKKIVNRSVSFKMHNKVVPDTTSDNEGNINAGKDKSIEPTFEEILSEWILKHIEDRDMLKQESIAEGYEPVKPSSVAVLNNYVSTASKEDRTKIVNDCEEFVRFFEITHYVNSITLGASEHIVMSETDYSALVNEKTYVNAAPFAGAEQQMSLRSKYLDQKNLSKYIGKITDDKVIRGSYDECVIQINIQPVQFLVENNRFLHLALHKVLTEYIQESIEDSAGPFLIECGDEQMYWKIDSAHHVTITTDVKEASAFHIVLCTDTEEPFDFYIGWRGETQNDFIEESEVIGKAEHKNMMRFLEVETSLFGNNPGPLRMKSQLFNKHSHLVLYNPLGNGYFEVPADITNWINGQGAFFISNAHRKGLLCISRRGDGYVCRCVNSRKEHNEENNWMLFRLFSAKNHICSTIAESKRKMNVELESLIGN